ncbi:MAG: hypothetical protein FJX77_04060 [Armatimonadetes bacterium]|nr:hypothetical protein [Armatimonadota bacterium]
MKKFGMLVAAFALACAGAAVAAPNSEGGVCAAGIGTQACCKAGMANHCNYASCCEVGNAAFYSASHCGQCAHAKKASQAKVASHMKEHGKTAAACSSCVATVSCETGNKGFYTASACHKAGSAHDCATCSTHAHHCAACDSGGHACASCKGK